MPKPRKPEGLKLGKKTFCVDKDILNWLEESYGKRCHAVVRETLRERFEKEKAKDVRRSK